MSRRAICAFLAACFAPAVVSGPAAADVDRLYGEYRSSGLIKTCAHSETELRDGLAEIPADVRAYDPGFADALNAALEQRPSCGTGSDSPAPPGGARPAADGSPGPATRDAVATQGQAGDEEGDPGLAQAGLVGLVVLSGAFAAWLAAGPRPRDTSD